MKNSFSTIAVLGATGSIGTQTLDVARRSGIRVTSLSAQNNVRALAALCREFRPQSACIGEEHYAELRLMLADTDIKIYAGAEGLAELAANDPAPTLVNALMGLSGLLPTLAAARAGKRIALANKETLVAGGALVKAAVADGKAELIPVDSEHSAIFQCLRGGGKIKRIYLTCSGGPFYGRDREFLKSVTPEMALKHPKWNMGKKISVDSASLMNKGLELIEAVWLFGVEPKDITVVIHPQSTVHSLVCFEDNAILAQLGVPDMRICIQYALTYPERLPSPAAELDMFGLRLDFSAPDEDTFTLLPLARRAIMRGGNVPAAMNGANEEAVAAFLRGDIGFTDMFSVVEGAASDCRYIAEPTISDILETDKAARLYVKNSLGVI